MKKVVTDKTFYVDSAVSNKDHYMIIFNADLAQVINVRSGSYNVVGARLFGLSYADYCRMIRDVYNGILIGKEGRYIGFAFENKKDADALCKELQRRWDYVKDKVFNKNVE